MLAINSDLLSAPREAAGLHCFFWGHCRGCTERFLLLCQEVFIINPLPFELCQNFCKSLAAADSRAGHFFLLQCQITKSKKNHPGEKKLVHTPTSISQGLLESTKGWCQSSKATSRCHQPVEGRVEHHCAVSWEIRTLSTQSSSPELSHGKISLL